MPRSFCSKLVVILSSLFLDNGYTNTTTDSDSLDKQTGYMWMKVMSETSG